MKTPKNPISEEMKTEIKYLVSGATEDVAEEPRKSRKKILFDQDAVVEALTSGKKFVLPSAIDTENAMYKIRAELKAIKGLEKIDFGKVAGTVGTKTSKKNRTYKTAQFFLYLQ